MKKDWPIVLIMVLLIVGLVVGGICLQQKKNGSAMIRIRYFDGSLDTIEATEYQIRDGAVFFKNDRGWTTAVGMNNAIIIEGDDGRE